MRSKWFALPIVLCIISFIPNVLRAEEALTLDQCISWALENNNLFKAAGQELRASLARVKQARAFPQPEFSYDSDLQPRLFNFKKSGEDKLGNDFFSFLAFWLSAHIKGIDKKYGN